MPRRPQLARDPRLLDTLPVLLGESGTQAARHLALEVLSEQMDLLALECVRSGGEVYYREYLGEQARLYVSLTLHRTNAPLTRAHLRLLPERVQTVLAGSVEQD